MAHKETLERKDFIYLPNTYPSWKDLRKDLESLQRKEVVGIPALEDILKKNDRWENIHPPFNLLNNILKKDAHFTTEYFCETLLPWLAGKALQVQELFADQDFKIPNLRKHVAKEVDLTRQQVCCMLALAFFNAFYASGSCYQQLTLGNWLTFSMYRSQIGKFRCLLYYFERIYQAEENKEEDFLSMHITVTRRSDLAGLNKEAWMKCEDKLLPLEALPEGTIESADGCFQVDFANAYIGGGVLNMGNVQEEIRFVINPECLVSILLCEEMDDRESILIVGAEQFASYSGYGGSFKCSGPHQDTNPVDARRRRCVSIVAMDAIYFTSKWEQYLEKNILRELNKAYCGFSHVASGDDDDRSQLIPVATGNWGCGMFGGVKMLKTVIQWMAASRAARNLKYYTFGDEELADEQKHVVEEFRKKNVTVGQLYTLTTGAAELLDGENKKFQHIFEFLLDQLKSL